MGFLYRTLKGSMIFEEFLVEWQNPVLASGKKKKKNLRLIGRVYLKIDFVLTKI